MARTPCGAARHQRARRLLALEHRRPVESRTIRCSRGSANSGLYVTASHVTTGATQSLDLGLQFQFFLGPPKSAGCGSAVLASIPLAGGAPGEVLPSHLYLFRPRRQKEVQHLSSTGTVQRTDVSRGIDFRWLEPASRFLNWITCNSSASNLMRAGPDQHQQRLRRRDFSVLRKTLAAELGTGVARHLAALAGLIAPANDPSSAHLIDVNSGSSARFNPFLRSADSSCVPCSIRYTPWSHLLEEAAGLAGIADPRHREPALRPIHGKLLSLRPEPLRFPCRMERADQRERRRYSTTSFRHHEQPDGRAGHCIVEDGALRPRFAAVRSAQRSPAWCTAPYGEHQPTARITAGGRRFIFGRFYPGIVRLELRQTPRLERATHQPATQRGGTNKANRHPPLPSDCRARLFRLRPQSPSALGISVPDIEDLLRLLLARWSLI